jgi:hypothetical protein
LTKLGEPRRHFTQARRCGVEMREAFLDGNDDAALLREGRECEWYFR